MLIVQKKNYNPSDGTKIVTTCPLCGKVATFNNVAHIRDLGTSDGQFTLGQRICPNPKCQLHLFFIKDNKTDVLNTFPALKIDFALIISQKRLKNHLKKQ